MKQSERNSHSKNSWKNLTHRIRVNYCQDWFSCVVSLQMINGVFCILMSVLIHQTASLTMLTDNECVWNCVYGSNSMEIENCEMCASNPPITYHMCYSACQHTEKSFELSSICDECFQSGIHFMSKMCRLACRNPGYSPNAIVCKTCNENEIALF